MLKHFFLVITCGLVAHAASGQAIYKKCVGCHGKRGEKPAVGVSRVIRGQPSSLTIKQLKAYRKGVLDQYGMGKLMNKHAKSLNDTQIKAVARYIEKMR